MGKGIVSLSQFVLSRHLIINTFVNKLSSLKIIDEEHQYNIQNPNLVPFSCIFKL